MDGGIPSLEEGLWLQSDPLDAVNKRYLLLQDVMPKRYCDPLSYYSAGLFLASCS